MDVFPTAASPVTTTLTVAADPLSGDPGEAVAPADVADALALAMVHDARGLTARQRLSGLVKSRGQQINQSF